MISQRDFPPNGNWALADDISCLSELHLLYIQTKKSKHRNYLTIGSKGKKKGWIGFHETGLETRKE